MKYDWKNHPFVVDWLAGKQEFIMRTSGSTGEPRPIIATRSQIQASVNATQKALQLSSEFKALICLPLQFTAGIMMLARCLIVGMKPIVVEPSSNPLIKLEEQVDFAAFVPLQLQNILQDPESVIKLNRMKKVLVGGAALPERVVQKLQSLSVEVWATYGMTETVSHIALQKLNGSDKQNFFVALPNVQLRTNDEGCLEIFGDVTNFQWITTRDVVELQENKRFFKIIGRADNIINSGGIKIQPEVVEKQVETYFQQHEKIPIFAVSSQPDELYGEKLVLVIESSFRFQINSDELLSFLKKHLPPYHAPKEIFYIEQFPITSTGKINRQALKKLFI
ncbi:MAG: AMP-binding protein [Cytophagales bacterium]|nr:AMP-binding protein [Cytophagales bacterium]MDW8383195.1 AMP-binding protein [Flammeovirgaceae bacterium]